MKLIIYLLVVSLITFLVYGYDKKLSIEGKRRISENTLLFLATFGGIVGAILGMILFRHKTKKISFILCIIGSILVQIFVVFFAIRYRIIF